jgi:hypothetical protein
MTDPLLRQLHLYSLLRSTAHKLLVLPLVICFGVVSATGARQSEAPAPAAQAGTQADEVTGQFDGVVTDVQGNIFTMEGGIVIDASNASIFSLTTGRIPVSEIKPGMTVRATGASGGTDTAPFVARVVRIRVPGEIILTGRLQQVDVQTNEFGQITGGIIRILDRQYQCQFVQSDTRKRLRIGRKVTIVGVSNGDTLLIKQIFIGAQLPVFFP